LGRPARGQTTFAGHHHGSGASDLAGRHVPRNRIQVAADEAADIALELRLGHSRGLVVELIEDGVFGVGHDRGRPDLAARPERHAETDHAAEAVGTQECRVPRDQSAPIITDDDRLPGAENIQQAHYVTN
jgi:hypothetical protein